MVLYQLRRIPRILICLIIFSACRMEARNERALLSVDAFRSGEFHIQVGPVARKDDAATRRVLHIAKWIMLKEETDRAKRAALGDQAPRDDLPLEYFVLQDFVECDALLKICEMCRDTEAGLTAVLLFGAVSTTWQTDIPASILEALKQLRELHSGSWQASISPLVEARLMGKGRVKDREIQKQGLSDAIGFLRSVIPPAEMLVKSESEDVEAILNILKVELPLRAAYFSTIAAGEYNLGCSVEEGYEEYLASAQVTYGKLIEEFPDTEHADRAREIIEKQIPMVLRLRAEEK